MDDETKSAKLLLTADDFLNKLQEPERRGKSLGLLIQLHMNIINYLLISFKNLFMVYH